MVFHEHNDGLLLIPRHDEEITDTPASRTVLTPEMVLAMFPLVNNKTSKSEEQRYVISFNNTYFIRFHSYKTDCHNDNTNTKEQCN